MIAEIGKGRIMWLIAAAGVIAGSCPAADDGGGRSVFATGAGNRALAMGGAFAAVADDASALLWNPAGLGRIDRRRLAFSQTSLLGLGFGEQYASLVLPDWRWGTPAVTWRRFGVDGIEERDDRGVLLDDNLQNTETELILGYGRSLLGGDLALGAGFKVRHHKLAGYTDSGLGLDLGFWTRPLALAGLQHRAARSLAMGVAVRNALEPQIKLLDDNVPDPMALRAGLAWTQPLASRMQILAAIDLERTRDMDGRLHAGLEVGLEQTVALRGGTSDGRLTAGLGVTWQGFTAEYQYEDHVLADIHRFGLSFTFGPTVAAQRQAAQAAAEAGMLARLEAAFGARNREREEQLVSRVRLELAASRWDDALATLGTLQVLAPDHGKLPELTGATWAGLAYEHESRDDLTAAALSWRRALAAAPDHPTAARELARVQTESDRRSARGREIRTRWEAALDALAREDLETARDGFAAILQIAPADLDAANMLEHTRRALAARAATANLARQQAAATLAARQSAGAAGSLGDGAASTDGLTESRAESAGRPAAAAALSPQRQRELADFYRRGLDAMNAGRRTEAIRYWELVWAADPSHERVREYLTQEYLTQGLEAFTAGALRDAVVSWEQAVRVDPDDPRARGYLERAMKQLSRMEQISGNR
ncbi:MAG: hypothetical protein PHQ53_11320 [Candidatus Krumholzibacteria bacterium]|nr:hypothetical protein [Candidatus Krumholzibacteria bacterium]